MDVGLNDVAVFVRVVDAGSFSAAARGLGVPTSTVSRKVARLEAHLAVRLLQRTTRRLSLTEAGRIYYERCAHLVAEFEDAERVVAEMQAAPRGRVRITMPTDVRGQMWPSLDRFLQNHPDVELDIHNSERFVDLIQERFDVALRGGQRPENSSFITRKLWESDRILVASPKYLDAYGHPECPQDLKDHQCVVFSPWAPQGKWTIRGARRTVQVPVHGRVVANNMEIARLATLAGYGIAQLLAPACAEAIESGELVELFPKACISAGSMWIIYPSRTHMLPAVRAFIEHVIEEFSEDHLFFRNTDP